MININDPIVQKNIFTILGGAVLAALVLSRYRKTSPDISDYLDQKEKMDRAQLVLGALPPSLQAISGVQKASS